MLEWKLRNINFLYKICIKGNNFTKEKVKEEKYEKRAKSKGKG